MYSYLFAVAVSIAFDDFARTLRAIFSDFDSVSLFVPGDGESGDRIATAIKLSEWTDAQKLAARNVLMGVEGDHTLTADKTTITADDVDTATVTVSPASGEYDWLLSLDGESVASSATLGTIDAADGYALAVTADGAGAYILRVIQDGKYKQITITAVE